jgi:hypothetical protein
MGQQKSKLLTISKLVEQIANDPNYIRQKIINEKTAINILICEHPKKPQIYFVASLFIQRQCFFNHNKSNMIKTL